MYLYVTVNFQYNPFDIHYHWWWHGLKIDDAYLMQFREKNPPNINIIVHDMVNEIKKSDDNLKIAYLLLCLR